MKPQINTDKHRYKQKSGLRFLSALICANKVNAICGRVGALGYLWLIVCFVPVFAHAEESITVAVASSLYPVMQQQVTLFEKEYDVQVRLISGSTGRLYNQIVQGAPFDLFIAADEIRPEKLIEQGKALAQYDVGQGYLGVKSAGRIWPNLKQLSAVSVQRIAIPNPDVAPFGQAAKKVLQEQDLWKFLKPRFIYSQNAMQALMMVDQGLVDAAFIPLESSEHSIATIQYRAALLTDKPSVLGFLRHLAAEFNMQPALVSARR